MPKTPELFGFILALAVIVSVVVLSIYNKTVPSELYALAGFGLGLPLSVTKGQ